MQPLSWILSSEPRRTESFDHMGLENVAGYEKLIFYLLTAESCLSWYDDNEIIW